ncbi:hypothetical protein KY084_07720 [Stakelama sp. CBK3Z-3]|uniref:Cytosol aminopeptidase domain-containing protein n=1 Tax=Stakelama flava TaxID=2860338 RepID=A0ABS6XKM2_9SPHN|nr:hypothetical protein [Stakelama flava]MBW4330764.1 hypothetical protein [Stakelama flava]
MAWHKVPPLSSRFLVSGETALQIDLRAIPAGNLPEIAADAAEALRLRSWRYDRHHTDMTEAKRPSLATAELVLGECVDAVSTAWPRRSAVCEGVAFARALVSEPGNLLHPQAFVEECRALETLGVDVEVLDEAQMLAEGMGALLAVGQGSAQPSRFLVMRWKGGRGGDDAPPLNPIHPLDPTTNRLTTGA